MDRLRKSMISRSSSYVSKWLVILNKYSHSSYDKNKIVITIDKYNYKLNNTAKEDWNTVNSLYYSFLLNKGLL